MAINLPPKWFIEGGLPGPTKPKNKYLNKVVKEYKSNTNFFNIVNNLSNQGSWTVDDVVVEAPAPSYTEGEWLYKQRQVKYSLIQKLPPQGSWKDCGPYTKADWQIHAISPKGRWEKQVYDTNTYIPYEQWYEQIFGFAPPSMFNRASVKPTRKIRVLNRPGETIER